MLYVSLSSPYHLGCELPFDLTDEFHIRIQSVERENPTLTGKLRKVADIGHAIRQAAYEVVRDGKVPLLWAGDCMAPISVVTALQQAKVNPTVVWFDAHGDFNTLETSWTGYLAGMSLAMLVGLGDQTLLENLGTQVVAENDVVLVDARHLDRKEAKLISRSRINHIGIEHLDATLERIKTPVYLHIDVDIINPDEMPAMLYAAPGGPSLAKVLEAATKVASKTNLCAMSVGITLEDGHPEARRAVAVASTLMQVLSPK